MFYKKILSKLEQSWHDTYYMKLLVHTAKYIIVWCAPYNFLFTALGQQHWTKHDMTLFISSSTFKMAGEVPPVHWREVCLKSPGHGTPHAEQHGDHRICEPWISHVWLNPELSGLNMLYFIMLTLQCFEILQWCFLYFGFDVRFKLTFGFDMKYPLLKGKCV